MIFHTSNDDLNSLSHDSIKHIVNACDASQAEKGQGELSIDQTRFTRHENQVTSAESPSENVLIYECSNISKSGTAKKCFSFENSNLDSKKRNKNCLCPCLSNLVYENSKINSCENSQKKIFENTHNKNPKNIENNQDIITDNNSQTKVLEIQNNDFENKRNKIQENTPNTSDLTQKTVMENIQYKQNNIFEIGQITIPQNDQNIHQNTQNISKYAQNASGENVHTKNYLKFKELINWYQNEQLLTQVSENSNRLSKLKKSSTLPFRRRFQAIDTIRFNQIQHTLQSTNGKFQENFLEKGDEVDNRLTSLTGDIINNLSDKNSNVQNNSVRNNFHVQNCGSEKFKIHQKEKIEHFNEHSEVKIENFQENQTVKIEKQSLKYNKNIRTKNNFLNLTNRSKENEKKIFSRTFKEYVKNNFQSISFAIFIIFSNIALTISRIFQYQHTNILHIGARACGQCLNLNCALLLSLILRRTITKIRNSSLGKFLPCDRHIYFHKILGWVILVQSTLHTVFHLANFAQTSLETGVSVYRYLFDTSLGIGWLWGAANITGLILLILLIFISVFSHRCVRKSGKFEIFYWTHLLSLPFWFLLLIHGPRFWKWLLLPGSIFVVENFLRFHQIFTRKGKTKVVDSYTFPSRVTKLTIQKPKNLQFRAGEYVYLKLPIIAKYEWHPFTISSAPEEEDVFTVHIRAVGGWTEKLYELFQTRSTFRSQNVEIRSNIQNSTNRKMFSKKEKSPQNQNFTLKIGNRSLENFNSYYLESENEEELQTNNENFNIFKGSCHSVCCIKKRKKFLRKICDDIDVYVDGPYGSPSSNIFNVTHAVLIGAGIGVTPFASILESLMFRYKEAKSKCPHCKIPSCVAIPPSLKKLRKVDFIWVNRDLKHFDWIIELLSNLEVEQRIAGTAMEKILSIQLYKTGAQPYKAPICLESAIHEGRPNWDEVLGLIREKNAGKVTVYYCGPPSIAPILRKKCANFCMEFKKEMF